MFVYGFSCLSFSGLALFFFLRFACFGNCLHFFFIASCLCFECVVRFLFVLLVSETLGLLVLVRMVMVICFGTVLFLLFSMSGSASDRSKWLRCLLWHGWLPGLSVDGERDSWAASLGQLADRSLEQTLGAYPGDDAGFWNPDF